MQRFRGGLAFKAHRLCVSLNSRLESNEEERRVEGFTAGKLHRVFDAQWHVDRPSRGRSAIVFSLELSDTKVYAPSIEPSSDKHSIAHDPSCMAGLVKGLATG